MGFLRPEKSRSQREFEADALQHLDALHAHALRLTRSAADADDLVQDTFVKALRFHDRFERGTNLKAWLFRIQFNAFASKYRRRVKEHVVAESLGHEPAGDVTMGRGMLLSLLDPQGAALRPVVSAEIERALAALTEEHRAMVLLADVEELSYKEIADVMCCPIGTVMSRLHRARRALQLTLLDHARSLGLSAAVSRSESAAASPAEAPRAVSLEDYRHEQATKRRKG